MEYVLLLIELINVLVWPAVVIVIIFSFKQEFKTLISSISELKIGRYSVILGKNLLANTIANKKAEEVTNSNEALMTREDIFNIPDDDYEFMQKIANNMNFCPTNESEVFKYNSLVNHGYFEKEKSQDDVFKPTKTGNEIIAALKSIYYR